MFKPRPSGNRSFAVPSFYHARAVPTGQARGCRRILSGPGLWLEELQDLGRRGLIEELLADGVIDQLVATAPTATTWTDRLPHPKKTLWGARRVLRGQSVSLAARRSGRGTRWMIPRGLVTVSGRRRSKIS